MAMQLGKPKATRVRVVFSDVETGKSQCVTVYGENYKRVADLFKSFMQSAEKLKAKSAIA